MSAPLHHPSLTAALLRMEMRALACNFDRQCNQMSSGFDRIDVLLEQLRARLDIPLSPN